MIKKSFIMYVDQMQTVVRLSNDEAGLLFKCIATYQLGKEDDCKELRKQNHVVDVLFAMMVEIFKNDAEKWEHKVEVLRENGRKGGVSKSIKYRKQANATESKQMLPNATKSKQIAGVNVNDNVNVNVNVNDIINNTHTISIAENLNSPTLIENSMRLFKLTEVQVRQYIANFIAETQAKGTKHANEQDVRDHFINWLRYQVKDNVNAKNRSTNKTRNEHKQEVLASYIKGR